MIETCDSWIDIDDNWSYFETQWKPKSWNSRYWFVFTRKKVKKIQKGAPQLDLFELVSEQYQYKVIVTNKTESAKAVVLFHNGRGSQELLFGNAKNDKALRVLPCKRLNATGDILSVTAAGQVTLTGRHPHIRHFDVQWNSGLRPV